MTQDNIAFEIAFEELSGGQVRLRLDRVMNQATANQIMCLLLAEEPLERQLSTLTPEQQDEDWAQFIELAAKLKEDGS